MFAVYKKIKNFSSTTQNIFLKVNRYDYKHLRIQHNGVGNVEIYTITMNMNSENLKLQKFYQ